MNAEDKVLANLNKPMKNIEISKLTGLKSNEVRIAIRKLRDKGQICSRYNTTKRIHMRLSTAIEMIFLELLRLERRLDDIENKVKLR
jgi:transcription initiation factor IIE alpha subunit